jgi:hypothetical protein
MPVVSVYIPSRSYGLFLTSAIDSVLAQSFDDWELFLIDIDPEDDSAAIMDRYSSHEKVHRISLTSMPVGQVANRILAKTSSEFLFRLDADDILDSNALLLMVDSARRDKSSVMVTSGYWLIDEFGTPFGHQLSTPTTLRSPVMDPPPNGACTLIRTSFLREIGGYSEDIDAQDGFDVWSRLRPGERVGHVNLPLFQYRHHGKNLTESSQRILTARRQIKSRLAPSRPEIGTPMVGVIPCRRNYDFTSDVWRLALGGRSLLQRAIDSCLATETLTHLVVTSDSPEALEVADAYGDSRILLVERDPKSTILNSPLISTLREAVAEADPSYIGATVVRFVQTPLVTSETIREALDTLLLHGLDSVAGVRPVTSDIFLRTQQGLVPVGVGAGVSNGYSSLVRDARSVAAFRNANLLHDDPAGMSRGYFEVTQDEALFVDSERSRRIAETLIADPGFRHAESAQ